MTRETAGTVTGVPGESLAALLGVSVPGADDGLPLLWHWLHLLDRPAQADLGDDGHPVRGGLVTPPGLGLRRMWAGGRVTQRRPLRQGAAVRRSRVADQQDKQGRSGPLTVVTVAHEVHQAGEVVIEEAQQLVYRAPTPDAPAEPPTEPVPHRSGATLELDPDVTLLFRFSALTWNAHRIHYDRDYATRVEGYPGLLVHGPLQAIAMTGAAHRLHGDPDGPVRFDYRLVAPLYDGEGLLATAEDGPDGATLTRVHSRTGRLTAEGRLTALPGAG